MVKVAYIVQLDKMHNQLTWRNYTNCTIQLKWLTAESS